MVSKMKFNEVIPATMIKFNVPFKKCLQALTHIIIDNIYIYASINIYIYI